MDIAASHSDADCHIIDGRGCPSGSKQHLIERRCIRIILEMDQEPEAGGDRSDEVDVVPAREVKTYGLRVELTRCSDTDVRQMKLVREVSDGAFDVRDGLPWTGDRIGREGQLLDDILMIDDGDACLCTA